VCAKLVSEGQILVGSLFNEPMRVETVRPVNGNTWSVGLVGLQSERFRNVTLTATDLQKLTIQEATCSYGGDCDLLRLGLQAYMLGIAYEFDPYFGLSISRVDPLPHQLEAVYDYLLKLARVRFLLADDAGAGKTIMAGLLVRELKLRGLVERVLVVCPANLTFQWQRELKEKFDEKFIVLKGGDIREQFGINQWLENRQIITSLDLAKRETILPGLRQVHWDLVIIDEAHRMSWSPPARKTARYSLGELLRDSSDHFLMLTATPHKGDPENFSLFLQLLDQEAYADVKSIREAITRRVAPFYLRRTKEAMVYFPERQPDGSWIARKLFTKRDPRTADFTIDGDEFDLYRDVTSFVKSQFSRAAAKGDDPRARAVGFLMALYQRRLASSAYSLRHSLENRARRLGEGLKRAQDIALTASDLPDPLGVHLSRYIRRRRPARRHRASSEPFGPQLSRPKGAASHCLLWSSGSGAGSGVTSTICRSTICRSTRSITRRMVSNGMPLSGSVTATFVGMSSPSSRASRASSLMSASAALTGSVPA
jgi:SNF2-related domain